jgi:hypothetical protein
VSLSPLDFLVTWYTEQCDGDWEHSYGISIESLDNPGWKVDIPIEDTELDGRVLERTRIEDSDESWTLTWSDGKVFYARCGAGDLATVLKVFQEFRTTDQTE